MSRQYPICNCGKAMIGTFAFSFKEYWCWYCGYTDEFLCSVDRREISEEELKELELKTEQAGNFLSARGCKFGGGMRKIEGELLKFHQLPKEVADEVEKYAHSWKYEKEGV